MCVRVRQALAESQAALSRDVCASPWRLHVPPSHIGMPSVAKPLPARCEAGACKFQSRLEG
eukprot:11911205-Alexandrium_andersonii.AAC.1